MPSFTCRLILVLLEFLGLVLSSGSVQAQAGTTFYVATSGSDANPGTFNEPFRSIMQAVRQAQPGTTVIVRGGVYKEEVVFDHGGLADQPITVQNYPNETTIIDGSMDVTGWTINSGSVYRGTFTHVSGIPTKLGTVDAAPMSTCSDGYNYSGDRRAYLYIDDTPDQAHWLRPVCIGKDPNIKSPSDLPAGTFATDVPGPPLPAGETYAGTTNTIYAHLADDSDPNTQRIRMPAYNHGFLFWDNRANYVIIRGLMLRLGMGGVSVGRGATNIALDNLDISLNKLRGMESDFCSRNITVRNSHIHDIEYEAIHLESDNSLIDNNHIEGTIAPWSLYGSVGINVLGTDNIISRNIIHHIMRSANETGGFGIFMEEWYNGTGDVGCHAETNHNNTIERNRIHDVAGSGIYNAGGDINTIRNNLIYNNGAYGINIESGETNSGGSSGSQTTADDTSIYFNTIYGNGDSGLNLVSAAHSTIVRNNILYKNLAAMHNASVGAVIDHNLETDPLFVNVMDGDFHLRTGSPAIGVGIDVGITDDFNGIRRRQGTGSDIGAFESTSVLYLPYLQGAASHSQLTTYSLEPAALLPNPPHAGNVYPAEAHAFLPLHRGLYLALLVLLLVIILTHRRIRESKEEGSKP